MLRPVLDALLALNIDLALDAVAIRFGFWDWGQGLEFQYVGVPDANFWAWYWVVFFFSLGYRLMARRKDWTSTLITGLIAGVLLDPPVLLWIGIFMSAATFHFHRSTIAKLFSSSRSFFKARSL